MIKPFLDEFYKLPNYKTFDSPKVNIANDILFQLIQTQNVYPSNPVELNNFVWQLAELFIESKKKENEKFLEELKINNPELFKNK